jgi:hypothetical protein
MGGSTLALAPRVAGLGRYMGALLSEDEILIEFRKFWWDTALSGGPLTAGTASYGAEAWNFGVRILWGSDFPGEQKRPVTPLYRRLMESGSGVAGYYPLVRQPSRESISKQRDAAGERTS